MPAPVLMLLASLLFATMGVCVKLASARYGTGEVVFYRSLIGAVLMATLTRVRRGSLRTAVPTLHITRGIAGVTALCLWFYAIGTLPLATAMTMNYMSSVWMAVFLVGGTLLFGAAAVDRRLVAGVLVGFVGVALVLQPTIEQNQLHAGLAGLLSGMLSGVAYLQVTALGRQGEPEYRVVFYFSLFGMLAGGIGMAWTGPSPHSWRSAALLLAIGVLATVAQTMMTRAYAIGRTLSNASLQYTGILFSFGYGVWLFGEAVTLTASVGMLLIIAAGLATTLWRTGTPSTSRPVTPVLPPPP